MANETQQRLSIRERFKTDGKRIGLAPQKGWAKRNYDYFSKSLIPALVRKREPTPHGDSPSFADIAADEIEIVWIGHATFLVRTSTFNALIDPVWAKWMGPIKRSRDPGILIEHLPPIDLVMISHAHLDHLCTGTLKKLAGDHEQTILVPKGVGSIVNRLDFQNIHEMDDWKEFEFNGSRITFTPARHWGARFFHDMHRGFGGYLVETKHHSLYHSGDSSYFDGFKDIGGRFDIDTAILPIGAYDCPSGRDVHMNPEEAVKAFQDLGADRLIPMHHETFAISNERLCEPMRRLKAAAESSAMLDRLLTPREGEQLVLKRAVR